MGVCELRDYSYEMDILHLLHILYIFVVIIKTLMCNVEIIKLTLVFYTLRIIIATILNIFIVFKSRFHKNENFTQYPYKSTYPNLVRQIIRMKTSPKFFFIQSISSRKLTKYKIY